MCAVNPEDRSYKDKDDIRDKTKTETRPMQGEKHIKKAKWVIGVSCRRSLCAARSEDRLPAVVSLLVFAATPCGTKKMLCERSIEN